MKQIPISYFIATVAVVVLSVTSGVAYGLLDGRWIAQPDVEAASSKLHQVPAQFGDWVLLEERELEENVQQMLRCFGYTHRVYQNSRTGSQVIVAVLFGPRGPIAVHTPEVCYSGQGVQAAGNRRHVQVGSGEDNSLWQLTFLDKVDQQPTLEVHYGWSDGGHWQAAEQPRLWFTDRLYKIQVAGPATPPGHESESLQFLELYLAQLKPLLTSTKS